MRSRARLTIASAIAVVCGAAALIAVLAGGGIHGVSAAITGADGADGQAVRYFPAGTDLGGRKVKNLKGKQYKQYVKGTKVGVKCQAWGVLAGESYIWDKTTDGLWVPDYNVKTGTTLFVPGMPRCDRDRPSAGPGTGKPIFTDPRCGTAGAKHGRWWSTTEPAVRKAKGSTRGTSKAKVERVIKAALSQTGKKLPYSWGAGGLAGPSCGGEKNHIRENVDDYDRYGYDCSGFTAYAFWKGAGKNIGVATGSQVKSGTKVAYKNLRRGDLIFWESHPGTTDHVALYLGKGKIVEAKWPRTTTSVHVRTFKRSKEAGLSPYAIRVFR
ncbi:C40 family peptidase [Actinomadura barringtoniae]|uniref:C40 family peptidase n=1 Tax=Actinomadura barringtoniae TaxID=1427535 RepID=A0A939T1X4_9ACTN|nr:C40 family peptidase [Actinomadura barringtoniae]MBO2448446.1 C40 family peptidase [Actinomadura barringtoniae]